MLKIFCEAWLINVGRDMCVCTRTVPVCMSTKLPTNPPRRIDKKSLKGREEEGERGYLSVGMDGIGRGLCRSSRGDWTGFQC